MKLLPEQVFQTKRLSIEPLSETHAKEFFQPLRDPQIYLFIPQDPAQSLETLRYIYQRRSKRLSPDGSEAWLNWAMKDRDKIRYVGLLEATVFADNTASIAYTVLPEFWRQGYAREGCEWMIQHLFRDWDVMKIAIEMDTRNVASIRLAEALGFGGAHVKKDADFFKGLTSDEYH